MVMKLLALVMLAGTVPALSASAIAAPFDNNPVRVSISPDATEDGYTVSISSSREGFTVDPGKLHVDRAALDGTVLARDAGVVTGAPSTHLGPPGVAQIVSVHVTVPRTALQAGMQDVVLRVDTGAVLRNGKPATWTSAPWPLSVHVYLADPAGDDALRSRYAGQTVYGYGPLTLRCTVDAEGHASVVTQPHTALRVARIERVRGVEMLHAGTDWTGVGFSFGAFAFKAIDPLHVVFDPVEGAQIAGASFGYRAPPRASDAQRDQATAKSIVMQLRTNGCRSAGVSVSGDWDLERLVTTTAPPPVPARIREGLTHDQVALIAGYPLVYATRAQLMRMPRWRYERSYPSTVWFDGDRVVRYQPPAVVQEP